jgi:SAM-dependent methyltransferase
MRRELLTWLAAAFPVVLVGALIVAWTFPYATDDPVRREDAIAEFYTLLYSAGGRQTVVQDNPMAKAAATAKYTADIPGEVRRFVQTYHLERGKILDVGSGDGYLQDIVADYTGIDIAKSAAPKYHKPFVLGTATAMPFPDSVFDAEWTVWVLEHIPNPEAALREIRRTVKPGGYLFLRPAWDVKPWASRGLDARAYGDLRVMDRIEKATIPLRTSLTIWVLSHIPARMIRSLSSESSTFHYRRLTPNFKEYWQPDSDAVNNLDQHEIALWFQSRGDTCLTCASGFGQYLQNPDAIVIRVRSDKASGVSERTK